MSTIIVKNGTWPKIEIDVYSLLHEIATGEQREALIESLSCHDEIIWHVVNQLIDGCTYNGFYGKWSTGRDTILQQAKQKIAENSSHAIKVTIQDLETKIKSLEETIKWHENRKNNILY